MSADKAQPIPRAPLEEAGLSADEQRAQELDQYYTPGCKSALRLKETDTALSVHMKFAQYRLGMQRALVSLINRDSLYYVADSAKNMEFDVDEDSKHEDGGMFELDESIPKTGTLCAETIKTTSRAQNEPAYFEVCDLAADPRFSSLDLVRQENLVYYCGVPIRTSNNIAIGTVFVLDVDSREPLCLSQVRFLASMAENVMIHLESRKQKMDVARIMKMNKCLASFMEPDKGAKAQTVPESPRVKTPGIPAPSIHRNSVDESSSDEEVPHGEKGREYSQIFGRAASLLRQALDLQENGSGVLFLDTASRSSGSRSAAPGSFEVTSKGKQRNLGVVTCPSRTPSDEGAVGDGSKQVPATILACDVHQSCSEQESPSCPLKEHRPSNIPVKTLLKFIKKAPGGRIWHYPELCNPVTGEMMSSCDDRENTEENEVRALFSYLPGAYQIIFIPLWNTHLGRWTVCMAYSSSRERNLTHAIDYFFCRAFCNCVKAEIDHCTIMLSDQQKLDFIGSVSHELRSPLHGILASCELIQETEMSSFQTSLIDTTESCAHTLLDTIQMVLDFGKVNAFAKNQPAESNLNVRPHVVKGGVEPILSVYSHVNVAAIAEEVIEGVTTGHLAKASPSMGLGERAKHGTKSSQTSLQVLQAPVDVILDVSPPQDWTFITQPGAYRRILMNVFGNSLKYTEHGFIKISIICEVMKTNQPEADMAMVKLTVADSGKGISKTYMETKMFTSFAQENPLAPGTGLGLSLVRSLVEMMQGEIDVQSELNQGTTVTVKIPMKRAGVQEPRDGFHRPNEDDIQTLCTIQPRPQIVNFQQNALPDDTPQKREAYDMKKHALAAYINGWYKIEALDNWDMHVQPDIVLVDDVHLSAAIQHKKRFEESKAAVVVLCSDRSQTPAITRAFHYPKLHVMPIPFGPFKLAKVLKHALEKPGPSPGTPVPSLLKGSNHDDKLRVPSPAHRYDNSYSQDLKKRLELRRTSSGLELKKAHASVELAEGFPFPKLTVVPAATSPAPSVPTITPQLEASGTHHRRLKTLDVPMAQQEPTAKHDNLLRSRSDGQVPRQMQKNDKPRILLVDDNEVNLRLLQTFFVRREYRDLELAGNGSEATKACDDALHNADPFDLVFMDIQMPVMDGFEATRIIREMEASTATQRVDQSPEPHQSLIIALTGNASAEDQANAFTNGLDLYMTKPVSLKDIGELMKAWEEKAAAFGMEGARSGLLEANAAGGIEGS